MFARFDEIPSLPVENNKEKPKCHGWKDNVETVYNPQQTQFWWGGGYKNVICCKMANAHILKVKQNFKRLKPSTYTAEFWSLSLKIKKK